MGAPGKRNWDTVGGGRGLGQSNSVGIFLQPNRKNRNRRKKKKKIWVKKKIMALEKKEKLETTCISLWFRVVNGYLKTMMMMMMMAQIGLMDKVAVEVKLDLDLE